MQFILSADGLMFQTLIKYPPIEIPQAQTTFISGDSGSGKSTLFKLFNATVSPSKGTILYQGKNISAMDAQPMLELKTIGERGIFHQHADFHATPPCSCFMVSAYTFCSASRAGQGTSAKLTPALIATEA